MYSIQVNFSLQRFFTKEAVPVTFSTKANASFSGLVSFSLFLCMMALLSCPPAGRRSKAKQPCLLQSALAYSYLSSIKNFTDKVACIIQNFFRTPKEALFLSVWRSSDLLPFTLINEALCSNCIGIDQCLTNQHAKVYVVTSYLIDFRQKAWAQ